MRTDEEDTITANHEALSLPPGRPTRKRIWSRIWFDDTMRLLHPKSMATYQLTRKKQFGSIFKTNILAVEKRVFPPHHPKLFGPHSVLVTSGTAHDRIRKLIASRLSPTMVKSSYQSVIMDCVEECFCKPGPQQQS
jgi:cytochrome P450